MSRAAAFILILLLPAMSWAKHTSADYVLGEKVTYAELVEYINSKGWDSVFYSNVTGTSMQFVRATMATPTGPKNAILYYWKAFQLPVDSKGDAVTDPATLIKSTTVSSGGPGPSSIVEDSNMRNMMFDLNTINPSRRAALNGALMGYRGMIYDNAKSTTGNLFEMRPDALGNGVVYPFKYIMELRWLLQNNVRMGLKVETNATGPHVLDQTYKVKNYTDSIHGAKLKLP
jgi:hypothetical protein